MNWNCNGEQNEISTVLQAYVACILYPLGGARRAIQSLGTKV